MKIDMNQPIIPDPFGFFDSLTGDDNRIAKSFSRAIQQRKEVLAEETIQNLIQAGIISESDRDLTPWLMTYDLPTLTLWLLQSQVLKEMQSTRLGLER